MHLCACISVKCRFLGWALLFEMYDENQDGTINKAELRKVLNGKGIEISEEEFIPFFKKIDDNTDGCISYREFLKWKFLAK